MRWWMGIGLAALGLVQTPAQGTEVVASCHQAVAAPAFQLGAASVVLSPFVAVATPFSVAAAPVFVVEQPVAERRVVQRRVVRVQRRRGVELRIAGPRREAVLSFGR